MRHATCKQLCASSPHPTCSPSSYFYATLGLGTPSRTFQLIIDTGSTITYIPCADCKHCGKHKVWI